MSLASRIEPSAPFDHSESVESNGASVVSREHEQIP